MIRKYILELLVPALAILAALGCGDAAPPDAMNTDGRSYASWAYDGERMQVVDDSLIGAIWMRDESEIDCIARRIIEGEDPLSAVDSCLGPGASNGGAGSGPPIGGPTGRDYDRLSEPDCGSTGASGGVHDAVALNPGGDWRSEGTVVTEKDGVTTSVTTYTRPNDDPELSPDVLVVVERVNGGTGERDSVAAETDYREDGTVTVTVVKDSHARTPSGVMRQTTSTHQNGRQVAQTTSEYDPETGECLKGDCANRDADDDDDTSDSSGTGGESPTEETPDSGSETGTSGQPGPVCELEGDCPVRDPRCAPPMNDAESLWDCVARTGATPMECLARIHDAVYATTGCATVAGPAGQPELQCPQSLSGRILDCLEAGGPIEACINDGLGGRAGVGEGENDDLLGPFRSVGTSDIEYVEVTGIGAILLSLCNEGVEQLCGGRPAVF